MPMVTPPQLDATISSCCSVTLSTLVRRVTGIATAAVRGSRRAPEARPALRLLAKRRKRQGARDPPQLAGAKEGPGWPEGTGGRGEGQQHVRQWNNVRRAGLLLCTVGAGEYNLGGDRL